MIVLQEEKDLIHKMEEDFLCSTDSRGKKLNLSFPDSSQIWIERKQEKLFWISGTTQIIQTLLHPLCLFPHKAGFWHRE